MKRGQAFVPALDEQGRFLLCDVLDLDGESQRLLILDVLVNAGLLAADRTVGAGHDAPYRAKPGVVAERFEPADVVPEGGAS